MVNSIPVELHNSCQPAISLVGDDVVLFWYIFCQLTLGACRAEKNLQTARS
jgi:hypothetical protein